MKKLLAVLVSLMMLFSCAALAETTEAPFEGTWVQFEEGFQVYLPSTWVEYEISEEDAEAGTYYMAGNEEGTQFFYVTWVALEEETTLEAAQADLAAVYPDAVIGECPWSQVIAFSDTENDLMGLVALDPVEPGMYTFFFSPLSDAEFVEVAGYIAENISPVTEEEAAE